MSVQFNPLVALVFSIFCSALAGSDKGERIRLVSIGEEELVLPNDKKLCDGAILVDSPARAVRRADGKLVVFATHFDNWYLTGRDWNQLATTCASALRGSENPDPQAVDDRHWIQGLMTNDGIHVFALASEEYEGSRHGRCYAASSKVQPSPCWYSSITQFESTDGAFSFRPSSPNRIVATPQVSFDSHEKKRVGFFTTSNIVANGEWWYVLIYVEGYGHQQSGTCIFRAPRSAKSPRWLGWDGNDFVAELDRVAQARVDGADVRRECLPISLGSINRGLVRDRASGQWIAVGPYREKSSGRQGIYYSVSENLLKWSVPEILIELSISFDGSRCPSVYKYPSLIAHDAPGFNFDSVGDRAYLYLTKVMFKDCSYSGRELVRIPVAISRKP